MGQRELVLVSSCDMLMRPRVSTCGASLPVCTTHAEQPRHTGTSQHLCETRFWCEDRRGQIERPRLTCSTPSLRGTKPTTPPWLASLLQTMAVASSSLLMVWQWLNPPPETHHTRRARHIRTQDCRTTTSGTGASRSPSSPLYPMPIPSLRSTCPSRPTRHVCEGAEEVGHAHIRHWGPGAVRHHNKQTAPQGEAQMLGPAMLLHSPFHAARPSPLGRSQIASLVRAVNSAYLCIMHTKIL